MRPQDQNWGFLTGVVRSRFLRRWRMRSYGFWFETYGLLILRWYCAWATESGNYCAGLL